MTRIRQIGGTIEFNKQTGDVDIAITNIQGCMELLVFIMIWGASMSIKTKTLTKSEEMSEALINTSHSNTNKARKILLDGLPADFTRIYRELKKHILSMYENPHSDIHEITKGTDYYNQLNNATTANQINNILYELFYKKIRGKTRLLFIDQVIKSGVNKDNQAFLSLWYKEIINLLEKVKKVREKQLKNNKGGDIWHKRIVEHIKQQINNMRENDPNPDTPVQTPSKSKSKSKTQSRKKSKKSPSKSNSKASTSTVTTTTITTTAASTGISKNKNRKKTKTKKVPKAPKAPSISISDPRSISSSDPVSESRSPLSTSQQGINPSLYLIQKQAQLKNN